MKPTLETSAGAARLDGAASPPSPDVGADRGRWGLLALVTATFTLNALAVLSIAPLGPLFRDHLGLSRAQVGLLLSAVYLGGVVMSLPAGWLTETLGVRATLALGLAWSGIMVALAAWSPGFPWILALLFLAGFGFAVVNPATGKAILERFPSRERGLAMGIKQTGLTLGGVTGSLTLPAVGLAWGWRAALTTAAGASLLGAAVAGIGLGPHSPSRPIDRVEGPRLGDVSRFLGRPSFVVLLACGLALSLAQSSLLAFLALFARESWGFSVVAAGGLLALAQAGGTIGRLGWGLVSDRFFGGRRRPGLIINALLGASMSVLFASGLSLPAAAIGAVALVAGIGGFGWVGLYLALAAEVGGPRHAGLLTGVAVSCSWSGVLIGPPLFGIILDATGTYRWPWLFLAATGVAAAIALSRLPPLVHRG